MVAGEAGALLGAGIGPVVSTCAGSRRRRCLYINGVQERSLLPTD